MREKVLLVIFLAAATAFANAQDWVPLSAKPYVAPGTAADCTAWTDPVSSVPAGTYGRVIAVGDHLEFEKRPGEPVRFLGVNMGEGCIIPQTRDDARAFAKMIRRLGWNSIRLHHHEQPLIGKDGFSLDPDKMRRFDAFIAACIDEGIYFHTDLFVTRKVPGRELHEFKESILFDENSFSNYLAWAKMFLNHRNIYTKRTWAEEPALAFVSLINEGNVGNRKDPGRVDGWQAKAAEAERRFVRRMRGILRDELGVKALISNMSGWTFFDEYFPVIRDEYDYVDTHFYVDHPIYVGAKKHRLPSRCADVAPWTFFLSRERKDNALKVGGNQPILCTEWNWSGPGRWRGAGGLMTAVYAITHGWDALYRYNWGSSTTVKMRFGTEDVEATPAHYWDMARDPFMIACERAMSALYLGGGKMNWTNDVKGSYFTVSSLHIAGAVVRRGMFSVGPLNGNADGVGGIVWMQSCDRRPLDRTDRILLTHLTRLENTGMKFGDEKRKILEKWGDIPYIVRNSKVKVWLDLAPGNWRVWRLNADGTRRGEVETHLRDGKMLSFTADIAGDPSNATLLYEIVREGLTVDVNADTGGIVRMGVAGDRHGMNWVHSADRSQYPWIGREFAWGLGSLKVNGEQAKWKLPVSRERTAKGELLTYRPDKAVEVRVERSLEGGELLERYTFRNISKLPVKLSEIDINTCFNDNYPKNGQEMLTRRCHAHVWTGGNAGYLSAMRINGASPHVGLMVTDGFLSAYELKERHSRKGFSNTRGIICLSPEDATLAPGAETSIAWRVFSHEGWDDFYSKLIAKGGVQVRASRYAARVGEEIEYEIVSSSGTERRRWRCTSAGRHRVEIAYGNGKRTHAEFLGLPDIKRMLENRMRFIVSKQRVRDAGSPYEGALIPYDNDTERQYRNWELPKELRRVDTSEGGERHCMGIFLAMMAQRGYREELMPVLESYYRFLRNRLQESDYSSFQEVERPSRKRSFNYPWIATFYLEMYSLTGDAKYVRDAYGTLKRLFTGGDIRLPDTLVDLPVKSLVSALRKCGMKDEERTMMDIYRSRFAKYAANASSLEIHEVGIAPEQIAGILCQLLDMYELTGEEGYMQAVRRIAPATDAMLPHQPSANLNDMAMHHWDGYWFGKLRMWGDTCPQDWNGTLADFFRRWAEVTGDEGYRRRADEIVRQLLMLFDEDGRGHCVFIYPDRVDGKPGKFRDPLANDQDWSLVFYMRNFK